MLVKVLPLITNTTFFRWIIIVNHDFLDLQAALGNKPNIKAVINEVQPYSGDTSQIIFHIIETNMGGQTRKINANDVFNALNQGNIWSQLQQRHSLESLAPKLAFAKERREDYLKNPPIGVDPRNAIELTPAMLF